MSRQYCVIETTDVDFDIVIMRFYARSVYFRIMGIRKDCPTNRNEIKYHCDIACLQPSDMFQSEPILLYGNLVYLQKHFDWRVPDWENYVKEEHFVIK